MTRLKKVLVPIDGSPNSLRALAYVVRQNAKHHRSRIHLINIQPRLPRSLFVTRAMISEYHLTQSEAALVLARRLLAKSRLSAEESVAVGDPADTILKIAKRLQCDELVMGTRGLGSLKGLLLGSVTTKVLHLARMPVTVIP